MDLGLEGRACVVTGGSRGIGLATARLVCADGGSVLLVARGAEDLEAAAADCERAARGPAAVSTLAVDVRDEDAGERVMAACAERHGPPWALVNNAGTARIQALEDLADHDWREQWELNVMAAMRLMRAAAPAMAAAGGGRIVNVSSSAGKRPSLRYPAYSVAKTALLALSRVFADAWAEQGVLVNAVTPGMTETRLWTDPGGLADQAAEAEGVTREEALASARAKVPVGRLGDEDEVAAVIAFLCSERSGFVTGAAWSVDGGSVPLIV